MCSYIEGYTAPGGSSGLCGHYAELIGMLPAFVNNYEHASWYRREFEALNC